MNAEPEAEVPPTAKLYTAFYYNILYSTTVHVNNLYLTVCIKVHIVSELCDSTVAHSFHGIVHALYAAFPGAG